MPEEPTLGEPPEPELSPPETLRRLILGFVTSQAVYVAAKLAVADALAAGPRSVERLATDVGADAGPLYRVLRLLAAIGVLDEQPPRSFALTELGTYLRTDAPRSVRYAAIMFGELPYQATGSLLHTVTTGETAFDHLYGTGHESWLEQHDDDAASFHSAISQLTRVVDEGVVAALNLADVDTLVDVGGGHGALLAPILQAWPRLTGILVEQESAVEGADRHLRASGVGDRATVVTGDFFRAVPSGSAYLLKSVLHAWPDERAIEILHSCHDAAGPGARLFVVERVVPEGREPVFPKVNDLIMLAVTGGQERTVAEFGDLFGRGGFDLVEVRPTRHGFSVLEGRRSL